MCEVQGLGGSGDPLPPSEKLSVSSESEDEQKVPLRHSLLDNTEEVQETQEGSGKVRNESGESEASKIPLEIVNNKDQKQECGTKEEEEEVFVKMEDKVEIVKDVDETVEEKEQEESKREAKEEEGCVSDENERENQENERRDEMLENRIKMEEMTEEKTAHDSAAAEENKRGNDEQASVPDSQKEEKGEEEVKETEEKDEKEIENKEKEEEEDKDKLSNDTQDKKTIEEEEVLKEEKQEEEKKEENQKEEEKQEEKKKEEKKEMEPIRPTCMKDTSSTTAPKIAKTVNFLESELKARNESKRHTINAFSSSSSLSSSSSYKAPKSKEEGDAREEDFKGLEGDEKERRHWTLGEGNPVYRLSMKLSPSLFNSTDIPGASQHKEAEKTGFLTKLSGRSFPYIAQWKRRYCVLSKGRLYYYEKEDSKAGDKSNGVIQLEYFDQVAEAGPKECKKATNVFIITSQDRSFFDPGRHIFSADTLPDMKDWIRKIQSALDQIRNNNRPVSASPSTSPTKEGGGKRRRDEAAESKEKKENQTQITTGKERRKKKEESSRPRKSSRMGTSSQTQTSMVEPMTCEVDSGRAATGVPKGGIMLPGFSTRKEPTKGTERSGDGEVEGDLPQAGPTLTCLTKKRVQGPKGQRAPRKHRRDPSAALKNRASSLSALEHQDASDNRSESSEGATRSYRNSQTSEGDIKEETESEEETKRKKLKTEPIAEEKEEEIVQGESPESLFTIDNIEDDLFFKEGLKDVDALRRESLKGEGKNKRRSSGLRVNFEESRAPPSKNGTLGKFMRLKDSFVTSKRNKFVAKENLVADHPDMVTSSRWSCIIL